MILNRLRRLGLLVLFGLVVSLNPAVTVATADSHLPERADNRVLPDPHPLPEQDEFSSALLPTPPPPHGFSCVGDGVSGPRIEVLYVHMAGQGAGLEARRAEITQVAAHINGTILASAQASADPVTSNPAYRTARFVTDGGAGSSCTLRITDVVVSSANFRNLPAATAEFFNEVAALGYNNPDRKYFLFNEGGSACGVGQLDTDDRPGLQNNNNKTTYAYIEKLPLTGYGECWQRYDINSHEFMHMLGSVVPTAPHATTGFHCWDEYDVMCYADGGVPNPPGGMVFSCNDVTYDYYFDCWEDDYFSPVPNGTWLSTHWNVATDSRFLLKYPGFTTVVQTTAEPGDTITASGASLTPGVGYRLRISSAQESCPSGVLLGGTVNASSTGAIAATQRILPTTLTPGRKFLCWVRFGEPRDIGEPDTLVVV